jgi:hypothetical protein
MAKRSVDVEQTRRRTTAFLALGMDSKPPADMLATEGHPCDIALLRAFREREHASDRQVCIGKKSANDHCDVRRHS